MPANVNILTNLNNAVYDNPNRSIVVPNDVDVVEFLKKLVQDYYTPDTLEDVQYFEGIVYHVREASVFDVLGDFVRDVVGIQLNQLGADIPVETFSEDPVAIYKVFIPKLHPYSGEFVSIPDQNQTKSNNLKDLYPDIISRNFVKLLPDVFEFSNLQSDERAKIGDVVRVSYGKKKTLYNLLYHGKLGETNISLNKTRVFCDKKLEYSVVDPNGSSLNNESFTGQTQETFSYVDCLTKKTVETYKKTISKLSPVNSDLCKPVAVAGSLSERNRSGDVKDYIKQNSNVNLVSSVPYTENRVRLHSFSPLNFGDPQTVKLPKNLVISNRKIWVHRLVLPRLEALNRAWLNEYPVGTLITSLDKPTVKGARLVQGKSEAIKIVSGLRQVEELQYKWLRDAPESRLLSRKIPLKTVVETRKNGERSIRKLYEARLIDEYGSVKEGKRWLAWSSPHGTGLAIDFQCNGVASKKPNNKLMKETTFFKWLRANAHLFGFTPLYLEAWHWECLVPRENWFSGEEFSDEFDVRVVEKGSKTGTLTTSRQFYIRELK